MESSKDVRHIVPGMGKDDSATRVFVPVGYIVDFVVVDYQSIFGRAMLLHLFPGDFFLDGGRTSDGVSSFSHGANDDGLACAAWNALVL